MPRPDPKVSSWRYYKIPIDKGRKITENDIERIVDCYRAYLHWKFLNVEVNPGDIIQTEPVRMILWHSQS